MLLPNCDYALQTGSHVTFRIQVMQGKASFDTLSLLLWTLDPSATCTCIS